MWHISVHECTSVSAAGTRMWMRRLRSPHTVQHAKWAASDGLSKLQCATAVPLIFQHYNSVGHLPAVRGAATGSSVCCISWLLLLSSTLPSRLLRPCPMAQQLLLMLNRLAAARASLHVDVAGGTSGCTLHSPRPVHSVCPVSPVLNSH